MNINKLINEAKKRYKVGDRFRVVHQPMDICTIESFDFHEDTIIISPEGNWHFNLLVTDSGGADSATVCKNGEWAEKVEPLFYTEDFENGELPIKSCNTCFSNFAIGKEKKCIDCVRFNKWEGELKGKPIYEGDKTWFVFKDEDEVCIFYNKWTGDNFPGCTGRKYFSNEYNARNYYSELSKQSLRANTGKFEIGDKVKVRRKCNSYDGLWSKVWYSDMDECVNRTYKITNEFPMSSDGYKLDCGYWFPEFVLEKVITKYLADEFQVLKLEPYEDELPKSPKGKLFDTLEEANAYHESVKPNTYTVELPKGYEVKREYVVLDPSWEQENIIDGIFLKLKHI